MAEVKSKKLPKWLEKATVVEDQPAWLKSASVVEEPPPEKLTEEAIGEIGKVVSKIKDTTTPATTTRTSAQRPDEWKQRGLPITEPAAAQPVSREHGMFETILDKSMDEGTAKEVARGFARLADLPGLAFEQSAEAGSREIAKAGEVLAKEGIAGAPEATLRTISGVIHPVIGTAMAVTPQGLMFTGTNQTLQDFDPKAAEFLNSAMAPLQSISGAREGFAGALASLGDVGLQTVVLGKLLEGPTPENMRFAQEIQDAAPLIQNRGITFDEYQKMKKAAPTTTDAIAKTPVDQDLTPGQTNVLNRFSKKETRDTRRASILEGMGVEAKTPEEMRTELADRGVDPKLIASATADQLQRLHVGDKSVEKEIKIPVQRITSIADVKGTTDAHSFADEIKNDPAKVIALYDEYQAKKPEVTAERIRVGEIKDPKERVKADRDWQKNHQFPNQMRTETLSAVFGADFLHSLTDEQIDNKIAELKEKVKAGEEGPVETPAAPEGPLSTKEKMTSTMMEGLSNSERLKTDDAFRKDVESFIGRKLDLGSINLKKLKAEVQEITTRRMAKEEEAVAAPPAPPEPPPAPSQLPADQVEGRRQQIQINNAPVTEIPMGELDVDPKRFQPRLERNEEHVQRIVDNFDPRSLDPLTVWKDPADGRYKVLNGNHRHAALTRLNVENTPVRIFEGTEKEAIAYARKANNEQLAQNVLDNANTLRKMRDEGVGKGKIDEEAKNIHGRAGQFYVDLSYVNPKGKAHDAIKKFVDVKSEDADKVTNRTRWIGHIRRINQDLTDAHENEMFDYIMSRPEITSQSRFQDFMDRIVKKREGLDPKEPLNLTNFVATTPDVQAFDAAILEAQKASNTANQKYTDLLGRLKQAGVPEEEITKRAERLKMEREAAEEHLATIKANRQMFIENQDKAQGGLFEELDKEKEIARANGLSEEQIKAAEEGGDPDAILAGSGKEGVELAGAQLTFDEFKKQETDRLGSKHPAVTNEEQLRRRYEKTHPPPPAVGEPASQYGKQTVQERRELSDKLRDLIEQKSTLQKQLEFARSKPSEQSAGKEKIAKLDFRGRSVGDEVVERTYGEKVKALSADIQKLTNEVNQTKRELFRGEKTSMAPQEKLFGEEAKPGEAPVESPLPPPKKASPGQEELFKEPNSQYGKNIPDPNQVDLNFDTTPSVHTTDGNGEPLSYQSAGATGLIDKGKDVAYRFARAVRTDLGEVRHVESVFTKKTGFQWYDSKEGLHSAGQVAAGIRSIEDSRVEHTGIYIHRRGQPGVFQYLSTGAQTSALVDHTAILAAIRTFDPEEISHFHNHPSGNLNPSAEDVALLTHIHKMYPSVKVNGIILDIKDGLYADYTKSLFGSAGVETGEAPAMTGKLRPAEIVAFDRNIFFDDMTKKKEITKPGHAAQTMNASHFGINTRLTAMAMDAGNKVTGHYLLQNDFRDPVSLADEVAELAVSSGAPAVVITANRALTDASPSTQNFKSLRTYLGGYGVALHDIVGVSPSGDTWSATDFSSYMADHSIMDGDGKLNMALENKSNYILDSGTKYMTDPPERGIRHTLWDGIKYLAGYTFPKMTRADRESAERLARYVASPQAAVPMARSLIQQVIPRSGVDENVLGAVFTEDMLRGNKNRYIAEGDVEAAAKVNSIVGAPGSPFATEADYQAALRDPRIRVAADLHTQHIVPELRKLFLGEQQLEDDVTLKNLGETFQTYAPLKAIREDDEILNPQSRIVRPGTGTTTTGTQYTTPFRQRSGRYKRVTGTAEGYDLNYTNMIAKAISDMLENHNKNKLYETLEANGTGVISTKGDLYPTIHGEETVKIPIQRRTIITKTTKPAEAQGELLGEQPAPTEQTNVIPRNEYLYLPKSLKGEYDAAFTKGRIIKSNIGRMVSNVLTGITLTSFAEPINHLFFNIAPASFRIGGWRNLIQIASQSLRPSDPANLDIIKRYTEIGAARPPGPPQSNYNPLRWTGIFIHHVDEVSRIQAVKMFDVLHNQYPTKIPNTDTNLREFVNQLGNYTARSQGVFVRAMKESGLSPFLTAIRTSTSNAAKAGALNMGIEGIKVKQRAIVAQRFGSAIALIAAANYAGTGSVFGRKDKYIPLLSIDTGIDDSKGQPITIPVGRLLGMEQVMQYTGARGAIEAMRKGLSTGEAAEQGMRDIAATALRPVSESPSARLVFSGLTGRALTPELQRIYPVQPPGESQLLSDLTYSAADVNPFSAAIAGQVLPEQMRRNQSMAEAMSRAFPFVRVTKQPPANYEKMVHGAKLNEYESYIAREMRKLKPYERMAYFNEHAKDVKGEDRARLIRKLQQQGILPR